MDSEAGGTQPELELLDRTIRHCRRLLIAKKERLELEDLRTTMISGRLRDRSLAPKQSNYDDLKRRLVEIEGELAVWSNYNFLKRLINRRTIKERVRVFIGDLGSIANGSLAPDNRNAEGILPPGGGSNTGTVIGNHGPLPRQTPEPKTPEKNPIGVRQPPSVRVLNGMVTRQEENPWAEGRSCRVWEGQLDDGGAENGSGEEIGRGGVGTKKVALKALKPRPPQGRSGKAQKAKETERAEREHEELMSELLRWAELHHPNILPFYGIVTDIGTRLYMVFPWRENGNLLTYGKGRPQVDKHRLLRGSAAGLSYLHSKGIVHGNVRCNNVFITRKGEPQICDFGIAKVFHGSRGGDNTVSHTKSPAADVRYAAPELIEHNDFRATMSSDTYSFALLILECITEAPPFSNLQREADIIHERLGKQNRPTLPNGEYHISNDLWDLMERCWSFEPASRPTMKAVHQTFCQIDQAAGRL